MVLISDWDTFIIIMYYSSDVDKSGQNPKGTPYIAARGSLHITLKLRVRQRCFLAPSSMAQPRVYS